MVLQSGAVLGVAGINSSNLAQLVGTHAVLGIAGRFGTPLRPLLQRVVKGKPESGRQTLGDKASKIGWDKVVYLEDYTFVTVPDKRLGGMRWSPGFADFFGPGKRALPLILDSAAFRKFVRDNWVPVPNKKRPGAPMWADYTRYCQAIDLMQPDGYMSHDTIADNGKSLADYKRMLSDGYRPIPVYQVREAYQPSLSPGENGRIAADDPVLRYYADQAPMVALGGMVKGCVPLSGRGEYMEAIVQALPGLRLWGLGQSNGTVINQLGRRGLLDEHVSTDGTWWIHAATTETIAVLESDGTISSISLADRKQRSFFRFVDLMAANLATLRAAYAGLWDFPGGHRVPKDMKDPDEQVELRKRFQQVAMWEV